MDHSSIMYPMNTQQHRVMKMAKITAKDSRMALIEAFTAITLGAVAKPCGFGVLFARLRCDLNPQSAREVELYTELTDGFLNAIAKDYLLNVYVPSNEKGEIPDGAEILVVGNIPPSVAATVKQVPADQVPADYAAVTIWRSNGVVFSGGHVAKFPESALYTPMVQ